MPLFEIEAEAETHKGMPRRRNCALVALLVKNACLTTVNRLGEAEDQ